MIRLEHVTKDFPKKRIFTNLSIQFDDGNLYGIYGPSGCGKTTLLNMVSMLDFDYEGRIEIDGNPVSEIKDREDFRNGHFSYIFSKPMLLDYLNVRENAILPLSIRKRPIPIAFDRYLKYLGLEDVSEKKVDEISEGEKQRVSVLRALIMERENLIADEPVSHLDHENALRLIEKLKEIAHRENKVILLSCHDVSLVSLFDRAYGIEDENLHEIHSL